MGRIGPDSKIAFIGAGMVGKTLAVTLSRQGYSVVAAASRTYSSAQALAELAPGCLAYPMASEAAEASDVAFITTPDDAIGPVAAGIPWREGQGAVHCSGAASLDVLDPARRRGARPGAFHPLQTFSSIDAAVESIPGSTFAIEGDVEMQAFLKQLAIDLGGNSILLRAEDKPLYHASIVMLGGLLTGLAGAVADLWAHFGIDRAEALKSLVPMIEGDATTLRSVGVPQALAGPYVRGDFGTIRKHLDALRSQAPEMLPTYCQMALTALPFALQKGNIPEEQAAQMRELLKAALADPAPLPEQRQEVS